MTAADDSLDYFSHFLEKIRLENKARQRIHMKHEALFSLKDKSKTIKLSSAAILLILWI